MADRGLALALALFVGSVFFVFREALPLHKQPPVRVLEPSPPPKQVSMNRLVNHKPKPSHTRPANIEPKVDEERPLQVAPVYQVLVQLLPTPKSADVPPGMLRADVTTKFGSPQLSAAWGDVGHLREKFIYVGTSQVTTVMIQDGRVAFSRTEPYAVSIAAQ